MTDLRNAVLATLAYYDIFDFPLTPLEVYRYLINPARIENRSDGVGEIQIGDVMTALDQLVTEERTVECNGYYMLSSDRLTIYEKRIAKEKIAAVKWKKLLRIAYWFQAVPFLKAVLVSGSMAMNNADEKSDFDVLVIARSGRLYTCRVILSFIASLFRARRKRYDLVAPDKFCFNHYITDQQLAIKHESLYNAQTYVNLRPMYVRGPVFEELYWENIWLNKYVYNFQPSFLYVRRTILPSRVLMAIARGGETILNTFVGNLLEKILRSYQQRRIRGNAATYAPGGRTLFDDLQLEFHPHSAERSIIERYNAAISHMGTFWNYNELDSGLT